MVNYGNGKIYKIVQNNGTIVYVGSTTKQYLSQRKVEHINSSNSDRMGKYRVYKHIAESGGWENFTIELIEAYPCNSKDELRAREGHFQRLHKPVGNARIEGRTKRQYAIDNKESVAKYKQSWAHDNKDKLTTYKQKWYEENSARVKQKRMDRYNSKKSIPVQFGILSKKKTTI